MTPPDEILPEGVPPAGTPIGPAAPSNSVTPSRDAYGQQADASAMADYLELLALKGTNKSIGDLADFLQDITWEPDPKRRPMRRGAEGFRSPGAPDDEPIAQDDAAEHGSRVFRLIAERQNVLGDHYPFEVRDERLYFEDGNPTESVYLALLAITVAHAYRFAAVDVAPHEVFESTVARAMTKRFPESANLAANRRPVANLQDALDRIAETVKLRPAASAGSRATRASDAKVDVISHIWWGDSRPAGWILLGQVTVGQSNTWESKLMEPPSGSWMKYLSILCEPVIFLAVPHHVEPLHLYNLMEGYGRVVVDRLRLARFLELPSDEEASLITALLAADVLSF